MKQRCISSQDVCSLVDVCCICWIVVEIVVFWWFGLIGLVGSEG